MSHFGETTRPGMRRKSSAQNILSSFKSTSPPTGPVPPPLNLAATPNAASLSYAGISSATPTLATTPLIRDNWDAQSLHSDAVPQTIPGAQSPQLGQGTSVEYLRDLVQKRIITLTYIRSIHEGRSHWFHTILISHSELNKVFNNVAMKKRTQRFATLGLSLSTLLDINQPQDLLRGLLNTITEYDQAKEEGDNKSSKMRIKFKGKNPKKGASGIAEFNSYDTSDASYLMNPSMPFPLDYHQTLLSLLDVLSEVYNKISKLLGPSPFPHSSQHMMGPLGLLSPHPGVSYLFAGDNPANYFGTGVGGLPSQSSQFGIPGQGQYASSQSHLSPHPTFSISGLPQDSSSDSVSMSGSLWNIAHPSTTPQGGAVSLGMPHIPAAIWTTTFGEMVLKIDSKLKKITSTLLKDLDTFARNGIKDELASLDPLLRNMDDGLGAGTGGKILYDFEGM